jgi:acyl carrier protein
MASRDVAAEDLAERILDIARRITRQRGIQREPRADMALGEEGLGLDSMGQLELFAAVESECGLTIPERYWGGRRVKNLRDLIRIAAAAR